MGPWVGGPRIPIDHIHDHAVSYLPNHALEHRDSSVSLQLIQEEHDAGVFQDEGTHDVSHLVSAKSVRHVCQSVQLQPSRAWKDSRRCMLTLGLWIYDGVLRKALG